MPELRDQPISQADLSPLLGALGADLGVFYRAYKESIEETIEQAQREGWDADRFIDAVAALLEPEESSEVEKSLNDRIVLRHYGTIAGFDIEIVDAEYIRTNIFIDWVSGGNHERYSWQPEGQIWIGDDVPEDEILYIIFHEYAEQGLMSKGLDYDDAHDYASDMEYAMRHDQELKERFGRLIRLEPVLKSAVDLKIQKVLVQIRSAISDEVFKAKAMPVGSISNRKDGKYKKVGEGEWERVLEPGEEKQRPLIENKSVEEPKQEKMPPIKIGEQEISFEDIETISKGGSKGTDKVLEIINNNPFKKEYDKQDKILKEFNDKIDNNKEMENYDYGSQKDLFIINNFYNRDGSPIIENEEQYEDYKSIMKAYEKGYDIGNEEKKKMQDKYKNDKNIGISLRNKLFEIKNQSILKDMENKSFNEYMLFTKDVIDRDACIEKRSKADKKYMESLPKDFRDYIRYNNQEGLKKKITSLISSSKKGDHWGSAKSDNEIARSVCLVSDGGNYKPIDRKWDYNYNPDFKLNEIITGIRLRKYAQKRLSKFSQEKYPYVYRGMQLQEKDIQELINKKDFPLTGCTAFTFYDKVAKHYSESEWTKNLSGEGAVPLLIKVKRNDKFDNSIGMWHEKYDKETNIDGSGDSPAFEILTGSTKLKIISLKKNEQGKYEMEAEVE